MVLLTHFKEATPHWVWRPLHQGGYGVVLFFILSGFLITRILLRERHEAKYFRNFYGRRFLRIFPLYYAVLALHFWVLLALFPTPELIAEAKHQGWLWGYAYNILMAVHGRYFFSVQWMGLGHFWTLAVEEQFYIVWPFLILAMSRSALAKLCTVIVVVTPVLRLIFYFSGANQYWVTVFTLCQMDSLALGALLACFESDNRWHKIVSHSKKGVIWIGALLLLCSLLRPKGPASTLPMIVYSGAVALFFTAIVALAIDGKFTWLKNRLLRDIGEKSYGMYVFHVPLLVWLGYYLHAPTLLRGWAWHPIVADVIFFIGMILVTYCVAFLSYNLYEKHFLKLKRLFQTGSQDRTKKPSNTARPEPVSHSAASDIFS